MIRNLAGNFWWFGELFYKLIHPENDQRDKQQPYKEVDSTPKSSLADQTFDKSDLSTKSVTSSNSSLDLNEILERQFEIEDAYEEKSKNTIKEIVTESPDEDTSPLLRDSSCLSFIKKNTVKMFLSNTGILNLKDINNVNLDLFFKD